MIELYKVLAIPENLSELKMNAPNSQLSAYQRRKKYSECQPQIGNSPRVDKIRHDPRNK
jgi:hypothetical protein